MSRSPISLSGKERNISTVPLSFMCLQQARSFLTSQHFFSVLWFLSVFEDWGSTAVLTRLLLCPRSATSLILNTPANFCHSGRQMCIAELVPPSPSAHWLPETPFLCLWSGACRMEILCMVNSPRCPQRIHYTSLKNAGESFGRSLFSHFTTNFSVFWTWAVMSHVISKLGPFFRVRAPPAHNVLMCNYLAHYKLIYCYSLQMFLRVTMVKVSEEVRKGQCS